MSRLPVQRINDEVYVAEGGIVRLDRRAIAFVRDQALRNPRGRARICAHKDSGDSLHEMLIGIAASSYVRPHRHQKKSESFHLVEGSADVVILSDQGTVEDVVELGADANFYYRLEAPRYHTLLLTSPALVIHETTNGPFVPGADRLGTLRPGRRNAGSRRLHGRAATLGQGLEKNRVSDRRYHVVAHQEPDCHALPGMVRRAERPAGPVPREDPGLPQPPGSRRLPGAIPDRRLPARRRRAAPHLVRVASRAQAQGRPAAHLQQAPAQPPLHRRGKGVPGPFVGDEPRRIPHRLARREARFRPPIRPRASAFPVRQAGAGIRDLRGPGGKTGQQADPRGPRAALARLRHLVVHAGAHRAGQPLLGPGWRAEAIHPGR